MCVGNRSILQDSDNRFWRTSRPLILFLHPFTICVPLSPTLSPSCSFTVTPLPFYLSSLVSMGAAIQRSLEVWEKKEETPGVQGGHDGPWGWAERWGTDSGVCDKSMSFTANDSHRGDQLLVLHRLIHALLPRRTTSAMWWSVRVRTQTLQDASKYTQT